MAPRRPPGRDGPARPRPPGDFTVREVRNLMVGKDEVQRAIGDGAICTFNALLPEQHTGAAATATVGPGGSTAASMFPRRICSIPKPTSSCRPTNCAGDSRRSVPWTGR